MKNIFVKKSVRTLTLGEKLSNLRNERRISLKEVSRATRIQAKYLEYLELGEYSNLPADVYVKGFLRVYAQFLGVDDAILMRLYEKEKGIKKNLEKIGSGKAKAREKINMTPFLITPKIIAFFVGASVFLGGFFYLYNEINAFANTPKLIIINPSQDSTERDMATVSIEGITDKDARVLINDQAVLVSDNGRFNEELSLQNGINIIKIEAINRFDKVASKDLIVQSNYKQEISIIQEAQKEDISREQEKIAMEIRIDPGPVWINIEVDGNLVFSGTMLTGAVQSFLATEKISISSGKANATHLRWNGKDIGALGETADSIKERVFDKNTKF